MAEAEPGKMQLEPAVEPHAGFVFVDRAGLDAVHATAPDQGPPGRKRGDREDDRAEDVGERRDQLAPLPQQNGIERKGRKGREAAEHAGRKEKPDSPAPGRSRLDAK